MVLNGYDPDGETQEVYDDDLDGFEEEKPAADEKVGSAALLKGFYWTCGYWCYSVRFFIVAWRKAELRFWTDRVCYQNT